MGSYSAGYYAFSAISKMPYCTVLMLGIIMFFMFYFCKINLIKGRFSYLGLATWAYHSSSGVHIPYLNHIIFMVFCVGLLINLPESDLCLCQYLCFIGLFGDMVDISAFLPTDKL